MALAQQHYGPRSTTPETPECANPSVGPENSWGFDTLLGPQSAQPLGTGSVLEAYANDTSDPHDSANRTLDHAVDVLGEALPDLRGGDSDALAHAEATALLVDHLEALLLEGDPDRIYDQEVRLHAAADLVHAEHEAFLALQGLGIAAAVGPVMALNQAFSDRMTRVRTAAAAFETEAQMHLQALEGALGGIVDITYRAALNDLRLKVTGGVQVIAAEVLGLPWILQKAAGSLTGMALGKLVDQSMGGGADAVAAGLDEAVAEVAAGTTAVGSAAPTVLERASTLLRTVLEGGVGLEGLSDLNDDAYQAVLGLEDACMALLLGSATSELPLAATELVAMQQGLSAVRDLVLRGVEDLETWRIAASEAWDLGGPDMLSPVE